MVQPWLSIQPSEVHHASSGLSAIICKLAAGLARETCGLHRILVINMLSVLIICHSNCQVLDVYR